MSVKLRVRVKDSRRTIFSLPLVYFCRFRVCAKIKTQKPLLLRTYILYYIIMGRPPR